MSLTTYLQVKFSVNLRKTSDRVNTCHSSSGRLGVAPKFIMPSHVAATFNPLENLNYVIIIQVNF